MKIRSLCKLILLTLLITFSNISFAQKTKREHCFVQVNSLYGKPVLYSDSVQALFEKYFFGSNLRLGFEADGERTADQILGFQKYGIGVFHANLNNRKLFGNPWAIYGFFNAPILRKNKFQIDYDVALGLGWNLKKYNPITDPKNDLIGSSVCAYFSIGTSIGYQISPRYFIDIGDNFIHFSNGYLQTPNKGMNFYSVHIALTYSFNVPAQKKFKAVQHKKKDIPKFNKYNEIGITFCAGGKATNKYYGQGPKYFVSTTSIDFYHHYNWIGKFGAGIDCIYDGTFREDYSTKVNASKCIAIAPHINHELFVSKVSFVSQIGTYIYKGSPGKGGFFFRVGVKYYFTDCFAANLTLKTKNGFVADYVEFGINYNFKLK